MAGAKPRRTLNEIAAIKNPSRLNYRIHSSQDYGVFYYSETVTQAQPTKNEYKWLETPT